MSSSALVHLINLVANILTMLVFISVVLSWILPPYHPVREAIDRLIDPLLAPIRSMLPSGGMFDFSPMVLMFLIQIFSWILINVVKR